MLPERLRYVVVEGPIGAGKTSLARAIGGAAAARLAAGGAGGESVSRRASTAIRERYALATQLFFLFQRVNQLPI